ncbi:MAG TPA: iron-containing alcohol dehydrogenase, partial [Anaerolineae bacterium]|nr:iron-containing alcohol dehydrogenase [Anaerolineae bacterium]
MYPRSADHFRFWLPPVLEFGTGTRSEIPHYTKKLGLKRVLLLADPYFVGTDYYAEIKKALEVEDVRVVPWHGVVPNPTDVSVDGAVKVYQEHGCEGVVAIGGGSALDTAKGVAVVVAGEVTSIREYGPPMWRDVEGMAPMILVPTTAGTGAEVGPWPLITNTETGRKDVGFNVGELTDAQKVAIVDPELTVSMPPRLTANTGMDAFCHVIECYLCPTPTPISDVLALRAMHLVATNLRQAEHNGQDMEARINMSLASTLATAAFSSAGLTYPHYLSAKLYDRWGLDHGTTVAVL